MFLRLFGSHALIVRGDCKPYHNCWLAKRTICVSGSPEGLATTSSWLHRAACGAGEIVRKTRGSRLNSQLAFRHHSSVELLLFAPLDFGGTASPSARAVLRLSTSSNLVDRDT
jgi:hypothetical protein